MSRSWILGGIAGSLNICRIPLIYFRNFVLNEDLALDYDIGGLAVSATFIISVTVFFVVGYQVERI